MAEQTILYRFRFPDGKEAEFTVSFDEDTMEAKEKNTDPPAWCELTFHQCPNCPLSPESTPRCPLASRLSEVVERFEAVLSYDQVTVDVETDLRKVSGKVTVQQGLSSLMGLIMATSGCPHTDYFRPMAQNHLPLAGQEDTVYRAASMYMLAQFFRARAGLAPDGCFEGLRAIYENIQELNRAMASRVRAAISQDAAVNAIVVLDFFAQSMPFAIEDELDQLEPLFQAYMKDLPTSP